VGGGIFGQIPDEIGNQIPEISDQIPDEILKKNEFQT
jgi:hypothetical protein